MFYTDEVHGATHAQIMYSYHHYAQLEQHDQISNSLAKKVCCIRRQAVKKAVR